MAPPPPPTYLGFDLSTQQLKAIVIDSSLRLQHEAAVDFDADFGKKYGIQKGVLTNPAEGEVYAPIALWLDAVDLVLSRLREKGCDLSAVSGLSGAGMQHGTVFWRDGAEELLKGLDGKEGAGLVEQLCSGGPSGEGAFAHPDSPNWQDASTQKQCDEFDVALGGEKPVDRLAELTGSKAHHRFSGPQILRYRTKYPDHYEKTGRISLVSSFLASIFLGDVAPIDIGDVGGMNLWDIHAGDWEEELLALAAGGKGKPAETLKKKLGDVPEDGGIKLGTVSSYFVDRYGFSADCAIIPFTGDNPSTILSLPLRPSDAMVSLGTSTTFLMSTPQYKPDPAYHFMNHPTTPGLYMFMLCYKNGGLAREQVRDSLNSSSSSASWDNFNKAALSTPPLDQADPRSDPMRLGLYFPRHEIVPNLSSGQWRYHYNPSKSASSPLSELPADPFVPADARNIVESQFLSLRLRSQNLVAPTAAPDDPSRQLPAQPKRVYLVGGGSANAAIAQLCGEVLGSVDGVYKLDIGGNACALGAAYKACWGCERRAKSGEHAELAQKGGRDQGQGNWETFEELIGSRWDESQFVQKVADGYKEGVFERYGEAVEGFDRMEKLLLKREGERLHQIGGGVFIEDESSKK
ncbi:putative D-Xylulose kinase [Polychaeton citri CBS 116435]|uniref:Xylulose kinase n=1 Tax=Polychaeton citri CBS 116435 TaxID=1314669 RepID=A0A9P4UKM7_9PEZI|nr:putative D-Xylulose kinase [Polychaeton citri CBS 116435]